MKITLPTVIALLAFGAQSAFTTNIPATEDSYIAQPKNLFSGTTGKSTVLVVSPATRALVKFDIEGLGIPANQVQRAFLRVYINSVKTTGEIEFRSLAAGGAGSWSEDAAKNVTGPALDPVAGALVSVHDKKKRFVTVDVTDLVKLWLTTPSTNNGVAIVSKNGVANIKLSSKEGFGSGYPAELEIESNPALPLFSGDPASGTLNGTSLLAGSVGSSQIGSGAVTNGNLANGSVTTSKLADGAVTTAKLGSGSVGSSALADASIGTQKIADGSVTSEKLASGLTIGATINGSLNGSATSFTGALSGDVTGTQSATAISTSTVTGKLLTGFTSATGALTATDSILIGIGKLAGNDELKAPLASPVFTGTVTGTFSGNGAGLSGVAAISFANAPTDVLPALGMLWIKPGTFIMGSPLTEVGRSPWETQHAVTLTKGFWMGVHEVTQAEYQVVIGSNPSFFTGDMNRPVERVTWEQAVVYCTTLTTSERASGRIPAGWEYRLPTEAEWEYSCRAGARTTRFSYDDDLSETSLANYAWYSANSGGTTHPVGQKLANPWGLMDMHGNVQEWCRDRSPSSYPSGSEIDPQGSTTGNSRALRGGAWYGGAISCRSAARNDEFPSGASQYMGFRVVLSINQP